MKKVYLIVSALAAIGLTSCDSDSSRATTKRMIPNDFTSGMIVQSVTSIDEYRCRYIATNETSRSNFISTCGYHVGDTVTLGVIVRE